MHYIYVRVRSMDEANDLAQETFIRAWVALSRGTVVTSFGSYLRAVARNVVTDWANRRGEAIVDPLDGMKALTEPDSSVEQKAEQRLLWEFLDAQLDKVLLEATEGQSAEAMGMLRKLAFVAFYVDGLTLPELQAELTPLAELMGVSPPTRTQLNNWLSRGDILARLVRHLVEEHSEWISGSVQECLGELSLVRQEAEIAHMRWRDGLSLEQIAERSERPLAEISQVVESVTRLLIRRISKRIKASLHNARRKP